MSTVPPSALDRARRKAYFRLLPLMFLSYVVAYVDRSNVAIAFNTMRKDLPGFDDDVLGTGFGIFFLGYFLLEIPGTLLVEKWSATKWISRIMITWGIVAALTACVTTRGWFYVARFVLGLAEAGFFPGVIVYLTHWFTNRDRARALALFFIATPIAQMLSPLISYPILRIGSTDVVNGRVVQYPELLGLEGWQWVYITWGIPAVILGILVFVLLPDRPAHARWLEPEEREALEAELAREKAERKAAGARLSKPNGTTQPHPPAELPADAAGPGEPATWPAATPASTAPESTGHSSHSMTLWQGLTNPKVLVLCAIYFFIVTGNYGVESFLPTILEEWYHLSKSQLQWLLVIPALGSLLGQVTIAWSSDRTLERRAHTAIPIYLGAAALGATLLAQHPLWLMIFLFTLAATGLKAYLPAFWSLPSLFLTETAAAGSIGLINSVGNLGGFIGPKAMGWLAKQTASYTPGIVFLCVSMVIAASIVIALPLGHRKKPVLQPAALVVDPL